jgi:hypothetical protein
MPKPILAIALALCAGVAQAADEPLKPLPGESPAVFQCRVKHVPEVRACVAACQDRAAGDARWECTHGCTTQGLFAMAQCREKAAAAAAAEAAR